MLQSSYWLINTRAYIFVRLGEFSQVPKDWELRLGVVGEQFFQSHKKKKSRLRVGLETLEDSLKYLIIWDKIWTFHTLYSVLSEYILNLKNLCSPSKKNSSHEVWLPYMFFSNSSLMFSVIRYNLVFFFCTCLYWEWYHSTWFLRGAANFCSL